MTCYGSIDDGIGQDGWERINSKEPWPPQDYIVGKWRETGPLVPKPEIQNYRTLRAAKFFLSKGFTLNQTCGIIACIRSEGGFGGASQAWLTDTTGYSFGMFAFYTKGVFPTYKSWCERTNRKWWLIDPQFEFVYYATGTDRGSKIYPSYRELYVWFNSNEGKNASEKECAFWFSDKFENCGNCHSRTSGTTKLKQSQATEVKKFLEKSGHYHSNGDCVDYTSNSSGGESSDGGSNNGSDGGLTATSLSINTEGMSENCARFVKSISRSGNGGNEINISLTQNTVSSQENTSESATGNKETVKLSDPILFGDSWALCLKDVFVKTVNGVAIDCGNMNINNLKNNKCTVRNGLGIISLSYSGTTLPKLSDVIRNYDLTDKKPLYILIHIGFNDVMKSVQGKIKITDISPDEISGLYSCLSGQTVYFLSVPYTNFKQKGKNIDNTVNLFNKYMKEYIEDIKNKNREDFHFIDMSNYTKKYRDYGWFNGSTPGINFHIFGEERNTLFFNDICRQIKDVTGNDIIRRMSAIPRNTNLGNFN